MVNRAALAYPPHASGADARPGPRPATLLLVAALLLSPLLAYWPTAASIVAIWARSDTYAHGYLIVPISLWLAWQQRAVLATMSPRPWWPPLLALAGCGAVWLLARLAGVQVAAQYAIVAMIPLTAAAVLGLRMAAQWAFPLCFLLFAVPVGDSLIEPLMHVTAEFTVAALRLSGVPVLHEGNNFTLPTGDWSVVEACSGLRYLVASLTLGCLFAYLSYTSWRRRALFVLAAALVPVLANGLRAYMIVMLGHMSDMTVATGADHLLYGWVFFGLVMLMLFWLGNRWRQPPASPAEPGDGHVAAWPAPARLAPIAIGVLLAIGIWPAYAWQLQRQHGPAPAALALSTATPGAALFTDWQPAWATPAASLRQAYLQDGQNIGLTVLYYRNQDEHAKLISSTNRLTPMVQSAWHLTGGDVRSVSVGAGQRNVRESVLTGPGGKLLVWSWYWIDGHTETSETRGKLRQVWQTLRTGNDDGAAVMLYAPYDDQPDDARTGLRHFLAANAAALDAALSAAGQATGAGATGATP